MEIVVLQEPQAVELIDLYCCAYNQFSSWLDSLDEELDDEEED